MKKMIHLFLAGFCFSHCLAAPPRVTPEKIREIEEFIPQRMKQVNAKGLAVGILQDGEILYLKGFGHADNVGTPVTGQTAFSVASVTKPFLWQTAVRLQVEGKFHLNEPVVKYLPSFRTREKSKSDQITIYHLISHHSGFSTRQGRLRLTNDQDAQLDDVESFLRGIARYRLASEPGERYIYSNLNYWLLGMLIEAVTGRSYQESVQELILTPLELHHSRMNRPPAKTHTAEPFLYYFGWPVNLGDLGPNTGPSGGLYTTPPDLLRAMEAVFDRDPRIVPPGEFGDWALESGFGWQSFSKGNHQILGHSGYNIGYLTDAAFCPESRLAIVVMVNSSNGFVSNDVFSLVRGVRNLALGWKVPPPDNFPVPRLLFAAICLVIFGCTFLILRWIGKARRGELRRRSGAAWFIDPLLPSTVLIAAGAALVFALPWLYESDLATVMAYQPDAGFPLLFAAISLVLGGVVRTILKVACFVGKKP